MSFNGKNHTPESKFKISKSLSIQHRKGIRKVSEHFKNVGGYTIPEEKRINMRGRIPANKSGKMMECLRCGAEKWVSPSRQSAFKYCSAKCRSLSQPRGAIQSHIQAMHTALDGLTISQPELRLGAWLLLQGKNVFSQVPCEAFFIDWADLDNMVAYECDNSYWHSRPEVVARAPMRNKVLKRNGFIIKRFDDSEVPSWKDLS